MLCPMEAVDPSRTVRKARRTLAMVEAAGADSESSSMAVSIAGVSTACSKDALVSSAKAVREALSTD